MPHVSLKLCGRAGKFVLCPAVLILLSAALLFRPTESAHGRASAPVSLTGAAARAYLEGQGLDARLAQRTKLTVTDGAANDQFGSAVAVSGDTAVVGAHADDIEGDQSQGSAYVFVWQEGGWSLQQELTAIDGRAGDLFGRTVAVSGDTIVVGAYPLGYTTGSPDQGAAYVFGETIAVFQAPVKLTAADGAANERFGSAVALDGGTALVGAPQAKVSQGAAYVFVNRSTPIIQRWPLEAKLTARDGPHSDLFGWAVAISDDTAVIGAIVSSFSILQTKESAYVFARSDTRWTEQQRLTFAGATPQEDFGAAVSAERAERRQYDHRRLGQ